MKLPSFRRAAVLTVTAGCLLGTSGCFGSFNLTRKLYGFNKSVSDDKFVQELVFLGLGLVQVYSIAAAIDAIVANSVEFWTGTNPINMASTIKVDNGTRIVRSYNAKDGVRIMTLETFTLDKLVSTTTVFHTTGSRHVTFKTVHADGRTDRHVAAMNADGTASVTSGTYADVLLARTKVAE
jgi:hypothetical protein